MSRRGSANSEGNGHDCMISPMKRVPFDHGDVRSKFLPENERIVCEKIPLRTLGSYDVNGSEPSLGNSFQSQVIDICVCVSVCLYVCLSVCLSVWLCFCLSVSQSVRCFCVCVCLFLCMGGFAFHLLPFYLLSFTSHLLLFCCVVYFVLLCCGVFCFILFSFCYYFYLLLF